MDTIIDERADWIEPELTILMPCLNEAATIGACIDEAAGFLRASGIDGEILICDNGSTDASASIAQARGARVVVCPERGYGHALRTGLQEARGTYVIMGDCDLSYDFSQIGEMIRLLRGGCDLVVGNRFSQGAPAPEAMPLTHRLGVPLLSLAARLRFGCEVADFHCGLRGMRRAAAQELRFRTTGMEFATEMIAQACAAGMRIGQTPVTLRPDGRGRRSNLRTVRDGLRHLLVILRGVDQETG